MQQLRLPSTDALRAFEAAARLGTFEKAADELGVTASAVGKRVVTLEDLLGTVLFVRSGKSLVLTPAGTEYLQPVRQALALLYAVPLHHGAVQRRERLRIRTTPTFGRQILVRHLQDFVQAHPAVEIEIVLSVPYLGTEADAEEADVEVRTGDPGTLPAGVEPLMRDVVVPVAAPSLLSRSGPLDTPQDLARVPLLRTPLDPWSPWFEAAGLPGQEPLEGPRIFDLGLVVEAALQGLGVALVRPSLAHEWIGAGRLVPLFDILSEPRQQYHLVRHRQGDTADAFERWLRRHCEDAQQAGLRVLPSRFQHFA